MLKTLTPLAPLLLLCACGSAAPAPPVSVEDAVVTLPPVPGRPGAAYFTIRSSSANDRLVGIESPSAERIELHETTSVGGMSRMGPLADASFSPGAPLVFAPGGKHAMLFGLAPDLRPGGTIALTFTLESGAPISVEAELRAAGQAGHGSH